MSDRAEITPTEVMLRMAQREIERLRRHADIAAGLLGVPQADRGAAWHIEADGVLRAIADS